MEPEEMAKNVDACYKVRKREDGDNKKIRKKTKKQNDVKQNASWNENRNARNARSILRNEFCA